MSSGRTVGLGLGRSPYLINRFCLMHPRNRIEAGALANACRRTLKQSSQFLIPFCTLWICNLRYRLDELADWLVLYVNVFDHTDASFYVD